MHFAKDETTMSKHPCAVKRQWIQAWQQGRTIDVKRTVQWPSVVADKFFLSFFPQILLFLNLQGCACVCVGRHVCHLFCTWLVEQYID